MGLTIQGCPCAIYSCSGDYSVNKTYEGNTAGLRVAREACHIAWEDFHLPSLPRMALNS